MKKLNLFFVSAFAILLTSCSSKYLVKSGEVFECNAEQFKGYVVSDEEAGSFSTNKGNLYVNEGKLIAEPKRVSFTKKGNKISVKGKNIGKQLCSLRTYSSSTPKVFPMGPDYKTPAYKVNRLNDVTYAHADGYWSSYSTPNQSFAKIYSNKMLSVRMTKLDLDMDIYEPIGDREKQSPLRPLLVMVHDGAFFNGDKADEEYRRWCELFAECGYVAVSVNYRLGYGMLPKASNVERAGYRAVQDVNAAIRYMLAHKEGFSIDPNRIYLAGCSAGAIASLNVAFMTEKDKPSSVDKKMGGLNAIAPEYTDKFQIRALCSMWGAVSNLDLLKNSNTSVLCIHGTGDPVVPYGVGYPFAEMLKSAADLVMPKMYGSSEITKRAQSLKKRCELVPYNVKKHMLDRKDDGTVDSQVLQEIFSKMTRFFYDDMVPHPTKIAQDKKIKQSFSLSDVSDVSDYDWQVEGGVVIGPAGNKGVNVLFFSDAPARRLSLSGIYNVGIGFSDSLSF